MTESWTAVERLILGHAILKHPTSTFAVISRSIRQANNLSSIMSHDLNFFSTKRCTAEYQMMLPEKEKVGRTPEIKLISELVSSVSLDRQVELKALIALSDEKISKIDEEITKIEKVQETELSTLLEQIGIDTDPQTENSEEDTDLSDSLESTSSQHLGNSTSSIINQSLNSPSTEEHSSESESTDPSFADDLPVDKEKKEIVTPPKKGLSLSATNIKLPGINAKYQKATYTALMNLWKLCWNHKDGRIFRDPVTDDEAPGYSSVISNPMDLSTIKSKLLSGQYITSQDFSDDMELMFSNAKVYNQTDSPVYNMAVRLRKIVRREMESIYEAEERLKLSGPTTRRRLSTSVDLTTSLDDFEELSPREGRKKRDPPDDFEEPPPSKRKKIETIRKSKRTPKKKTKS